MNRIADSLLYGIVDLGYVDADETVPVARRMIKGGIDILQLRAKRESREHIRRLAEMLLPVTREAGVPLILNDHPDIAADVGTDGVHVGQDDMPVDAAREIVGSEAIVGKSTHSLAQAEAASAEAVDYIGFGPLFATPTKPEYPAIGLEDIGRVHERVGLPVFCIGGIKLANLPQVVEAGARRAVVVSEILQAPDVATHVNALKNILTNN